MMLIVPIFVTLLSNVIEQGDDVHKAQHPDPPCDVQITCEPDDDVGLPCENVLGLDDG